MSSSTKADQKESAPRALVWLVVGMGLALIGGTALLIGKIINQSEACHAEQIQLPAGAQVIGADADRLSVLVESEAGQSLQLYDVCRGKLRREIKITTD